MGRGKSLLVKLGLSLIGNGYTGYFCVIHSFRADAKWLIYKQFNFCKWGFGHIAP